ncbi:hypothetical protein [Acinetobacter bereziniae]|uniref:hypothetical protein n=1 Tax=Acinetobacter bereziniae TaxID=106648 RepID=UPI00125FFF41|nr:hypothetical protein [Acinetobacter bereziniae]
MTTINNDQSLIEKVGGIDRAREIMDGAPDWATHFNQTDNKYEKQIKVISLGFTAVNYSLACLKSNKDEVICLDDLRTAIAKHDLKQCQHGYDIACLICGFGTENGVRVWRKQIESDEVTDIRNHVSPSTIVKDLEAERHG